MAAKIAAGEPIPDEMKYLAGLFRISNVFFYPETGDIVLAGWAEGFAEDNVGRVRGLSTGWPVVELQDLATALRAYPPSGAKAGMIGCSIDPTEQGLKNLQEFIKKGSRLVRANPNPATIRNFALGMRQQLGLQDVTVDGIPPETHFAQVLVEADYRMKLVGIGLEKPPVDISSFIAVARPVPWQATRWCVGISRRSTSAFASAKMARPCKWKVGASSSSALRNWSAAGGGRSKAGDAQSMASKKFCESFTKNYPGLGRS